VRAKPITQLLVSALALERRTRVRLSDVVCTSFDKRHYAECDPLHVVHNRAVAQCRSHRSSTGPHGAWGTYALYGTVSSHKGID
jgi:hypothetical protein